MKKSILVFDFQFLQTDAYKRGMGFYAKNLTQSFLKEYSKYYSEIVLIGTTELPKDNLVDMVAALQELGLEKKLKCNYLDLQINNFDAHDLDQKFIDNKISIDQFADALAKRAKVIWFTPSITQEPCITVLPTSSTSIKTVVLWHDMIPYLYADHYLADANSAFTQSYLKRMCSLYFVDQILTNSETTKNDLLQYLFIDEKKVAVVYGGSGLTRTSVNDQASGYGEFILCVTSPEINKNLSNTLSAFSHFNTLKDDKYKLVIPSDFSDDIKNQYGQKLKNVVFTGHVSDESLSVLYDECAFLLYPSKYDGLGMPIIEAVHAGKPIVTSNLPVFREFDTNAAALYLCDPDNPGSIVQEMLSVLRNEKKGKQKVVYESIVMRYDWKKVASRVYDEISKLVIEKNKTKKVHSKIAIVGPHPASFSSIGKFIAEQFGHILQKAGVVDYYYDSGPSDRVHGSVRRSPFQVYDRLFPICDLTIEKANSYREVIYHIGNSDHHMLTYLLAHTTPGTLVLHDTNLAGNGMISQMRNYGLLSPERVDYEALIEEDILKRDVRLITSLVSSQHKVMVHSKDAKKIVRNYDLFGDSTIILANHPMNTLSATAKCNHDRDGDLRIAIAGILMGVKGLDVLDKLLQATAGNSVSFDVFGFNYFADKRLLRQLQNNHPHLRVLSNLTDYEFQRTLAQQDILFNYRPEYRGEASRATLEALRLGVIPIIRKVGWYDELPESICFKVDTHDAAINLVEKLSINVPEAKALLAKKSKKINDILLEHYTVDKYVEELLS